MSSKIASSRFMSFRLTVSDIDIGAYVRHTAHVDELYKQFGRQLRGFREEAGLTQDQIAERVKLKRTSITNIERGHQHIALHQLFLLAAAVGKNPSELLPATESAMRGLLPNETMVALRASAEHDDDLDFAIRVVSKGQPQTEAPTE
ncbi:MAG TPA: helix-turn-helix transcriptional regulator [Solirubrobacteraceae bacterium]|jgi:transcriptional regulator with XRE-family HTH domain|nr:helix-turn-helix transcriptional regulator [Solirubrobacteraceae bacterium]